MLGKVVFDNCSECDCGEERFIVNKTRYLCEQKNRERLDKNKAPKEKKTLESLRKNLPQISKKKSTQLSEYSKVCSKISESREHRCESCGTDSYLSYSHLVPRSRRQDLVTEPKNIKIQCTCRLDGSLGCHQRYEDGNIDDFLDRDEILSLLKELDTQFYTLKFEVKR